MSDFPPWEWVDGDPVRATQFAFIRGLVLGIAGALGTLLIVGLLGATAVFATVDILGLPFVLLWVSAMCLLAVELPIFYYFPRRYPVISRLGVSPVGIRVRHSFRGFTFRWGKVPGLGPDWIEVEGVWGSTQRYRLTANQQARVAAFYQSPYVVLPQPSFAAP